MSLRMRKSKVPAPPAVCPLTECMALLGGAWTPNVIWYLSGGPRRFGELRADIPRISAKVLTARLRELEGKGVVIRRVLPTSPPSVEYALTELGRELLPAINAIVDVGARLKAVRAGSDGDSVRTRSNRSALSPRSPGTSERRAGSSRV